MKFPVFDLHCDTVFELLRYDQSQNTLYENGLHIDLLRAKHFVGYAQCFACFTTPLLGDDPRITFRKELECITRQIAHNADKIQLACSSEQIAENLRSNIISAILTIEGPAGFDYDSEQLKLLYDVGFRMTTLGWNESNPLTGSHATGGGLTEKGRAYVKEAQRLGMLIDVSHISDEGFWDIMDISQKPIVASHSNSRSIWNVSRNITDDMFLAICRTGGVVGINLYADFLGKNPTIETVCDHITHFLSLDPSGKHIALGGDLDGCDKMPAGFRGVQDYEKVANALLDRGLCDSTVFDVFWNNAHGVIKQCCM